jgi:GNAT superfamily N-acetyltransferase
MPLLRAGRRRVSAAARRRACSDGRPDVSLQRAVRDIYMETVEPFRRQGFGSYLVQELKRCAYELESIPCARCNPANIASRKTLQKAGLVPFAHILTGSICGT